MRDVLLEPALRTLIDDQSVYLDEGETVDVSIRVQLRGKDAPAGTRVVVY